MPSFNVFGRGFPPWCVFTGLVGECSHIDFCPGKDIIEPVWFLRGIQCIAACIHPFLPIFFGFNLQHNRRSQCCELGAHGKQAVNRRENQHKPSFALSRTVASSERRSQTGPLRVTAFKHSWWWWAAAVWRAVHLPPGDPCPTSANEANYGEKHDPTTESNQRTFCS